MKNTSCLLLIAALHAPLLALPASIKDAETHKMESEGASAQGVFT